MKEKKHFLIIYDIIEDRKRQKVVKVLRGYGFRVQKSAFEAKLNGKQYQKLLNDLKKYASIEDSIRIYELPMQNKQIALGKQEEIDFQDIIIM